MTETAPSRSYRIYVVTLLVLVYFFYMVDRQAIVISQEMIKAEFGISDAVMGMLTGTIYGLAYALASLPLGWAADRVNRRNLLAGLVGIWSALTALCGLSASYIHLAFARLGIGAAEAGGAPAALSILSDMFPPERRATVTSIFFAGAGLGSVISFMLGGYIATHYGWRSVFILFGLPGILLAVLIFFTVREPARSKKAKPPKSSNPLRDIRDTLRKPGLGALYLATALSSLSVTGAWTWMVPFFMRSYDLSLTETGTIVALGTGVFCTVGMVVTSILSDRARRRSPVGPMKVVLWGSAIHLVLGAVVLWTHSLPVAIMGLCGMGAFMLVNVGPTNAIISEVAPAHTQGLSFAMFTFVSNVVGSGLGPLFIGLLSDHLGGSSEALRQAMTMILMAQLVAIGAYFVVVRRLRQMKIEGA